MIKQGNIIFLNGCSSSGKTSVAKALQEIMDGYYIHTGIDHYLEKIPQKIHAMSDGKNPAAADGFLWVYPNDGGQVSEIRIGPVGYRLLVGMYRATAALAAAGNDLIIDDVVFDGKVLRAAVDALYTSKVLFVGVFCPYEVLVQREMMRKDGIPGLVKAHYDIVHAHGIYDIEVDTSTLTPMECAFRIRDRLVNGRPLDAICKLRKVLGER